MDVDDVLLICCVRRSMRLKLINKGFKSSPTSCKDKNCLGCAAKPPTISPKVIRNLVASFCGINPVDLTPTIKKKKSVKNKKAGSSASQNSSDQASPSSSHSFKNGATDPST